jgi:hypothetical protein
MILINHAAHYAPGWDDFKARPWMRISRESQVQIRRKPSLIRATSCVMHTAMLISESTSRMPQWNVKGINDTRISCLHISLSTLALNLSRIAELWQASSEYFKQGETGILRKWFVNRSGGIANNILSIMSQRTQYVTACLRILRRLI